MKKSNIIMTKKRKMNIKRKVLMVIAIIVVRKVIGLKIALLHINEGKKKAVDDDNDEDLMLYLLTTEDKKEK